jgi:hypothetical protein
MSLPGNRLGAFTVTDVLIVVATVAVLGGLAYSGFNPLRRHRNPARITCVNNLRQMGLACRVWANDHQDKFATSVPTVEGGALEFAASGSVARIFQIMSNEMSSPKILFCPTDIGRQRATNFFSLADSNISYFLNLDADATHPQAILIGDRNISTNGQLMSGILTLPTANQLAWTADIHKNNGNVGLADGSAQQVTDSVLSKAIANMTSKATNPMRLALPSK